MTDPLLRADLDAALARDAVPWADLRGGRLFVTGGTGFVGRWMLETLLAADAAFGLGVRVVVLTRSPRAFEARSPHLASDPAIALHAGDAASFGEPDGSFTHVVHAATERAFPADAERPLSILEADRLATLRVLDFARRRGVRRLLFTSTGAVYGRQPADLPAIPETYTGAPDTTDPSTVYGQSKRLSEFACASYAAVAPIEIVIARLFAFAGPHLPLDEGYAVGNFVRDALDATPITIGGDGTPVRSYLYAADLAVWLWTLLLRGGNGGAYNVGSAEPISIKDLAERVSARLAPRTQVRIARAPVPGSPPARYVPDTSRAAELGLTAWTPLDTALARMYDYARQTRRISSAS